MILNLLNKEKQKTERLDLLKMVALLIHAAKIDENYSEKEKEMVIDFVLSSTKLEKENDEKIKKISREEAISLVKKAEEYENKSNQILEYTREVKKMNEDLKIKVVETLWRIILSDNKSDIYESNLMRRICGLLYLPDKLSGEIKVNVLKGKK